MISVRLYTTYKRIAAVIKNAIVLFLPRRHSHCRGGVIKQIALSLCFSLCVSVIYIGGTLLLKTRDCARGAGKTFSSLLVSRFERFSLSSGSHTCLVGHELALIPINPIDARA
jgi:hypothetical protein